MEFVPQLKGVALSVAVALAGGEVHHAARAALPRWLPGGGGLARSMVRPPLVAVPATPQDKPAENENAGRSSEP